MDIGKNCGLRQRLAPLPGPEGSYFQRAGKDSVRRAGRRSYLCCVGGERRVLFQDCGNVILVRDLEQGNAVDGLRHVRVTQVGGGAGSRRGFGIGSCVGAAQLVTRRLLKHGRSDADAGLVVGSGRAAGLSIALTAALMLMLMLRGRGSRWASRTSDSGGWSHRGTPPHSSEFGVAFSLVRHAERHGELAADTIARAYRSKRAVSSVSAALRHRAMREDILSLPARPRKGPRSLISQLRAPHRLLRRCARAGRVSEDTTSRYRAREPLSRRER